MSNDDASRAAPHDEGGLAFPLIIPAPGFQHIEYGMFLRDYFAAAALTGICAEGGMESEGDAADWAYRHADAMLKARAK